MTDGALAGASSYAQVRVREPMGDRILGETPTIGGEGSDIVVPGVGPGEAVRIERGRGVWTVHATSYNVRVRFDGRLITSPRDLRRHDVLTIGDAQVVVTDVSRTLLRLDVCHLVGNATISPAGAVWLFCYRDCVGDLFIRAARPATADGFEGDVEKDRGVAARRGR